MNEILKTQPESSLNHLKELHNDTMETVGKTIFRNLIINPRLSVRHADGVLGWGGSLTGLTILENSGETTVTNTLGTPATFAQSFSLNEGMEYCLVAEVLTSGTLTFTVSENATLHTLTFAPDVVEQRQVVRFVAGTDGNATLTVSLSGPSECSIRHLGLVQGGMEIGRDTPEVELAQIFAGMLRYSDGRWQLAHTTAFGQVLTEGSIAGTNGITIQNIGGVITFSQPNITLTGDAVGTVNPATGEVAVSVNEIAGNLLVHGDFAVEGNSVQMNVEQVSATDPLLVLNNQYAVLPDRSGIDILTGPGATDRIGFYWDSVNQGWKVRTLVNGVYAEHDLLYQGADILSLLEAVDIIGQHTGIEVSTVDNGNSLDFRVNRFTVALAGDMTGSTSFQLNNDDDILTLNVTAGTNINAHSVDGCHVDQTGLEVSTERLWPTSVIDAKIDAALQAVTSPSSSYSRMFEERVITSPQPGGTTFTLINPNFYAFNMNTLEVYRNGQRLSKGVDYNEVGTVTGEQSTQVTFLTPLAVDERIIFTEGRTNGSAEWSMIQNKPASFPPSTHTHPELNGFFGEMRMFAIPSTAGILLPAGWVYAEGQDLPLPEYQAWADAVGTTYGVAPAGFVKAPDMRGVSPRGYDNGRGLDPGRVFGSYQADEFKNHQHVFSGDDNIPGGFTILGTYAYDAKSDGAWGGHTFRTKNDTTNSGGTETRGKNLSTFFIVKVKP